MSRKQSLQEWLQALGEKIRKDKKLLLPVCIGLLAMLALLLSQWSDYGSAKNETPEVTQQSAVLSDSDEYAKKVETQLSELLGAMQDVGRVRVMVTLENSVEQVYAENIQHKSANAGQGSVSGSAGSESLDEKYEYLVVRDANGNETGLLVKLVQPKIRGVAVVCQGGGSASVQQAVLSAVIAVLNISPLRVSVSAGF